jgi:hypothetical protein
MTKKRLLFYLIISCFLCFTSINIIPKQTLAADNSAGSTWEIDYPGTAPAQNDLPGYIKYLYEFSFIAGTALAVLMIILGGVQWSTTSVNPATKADAKKRITNAVLGLVFLFATYAILYTINPDLVNLKDPSTIEYKPNYDYTTGSSLFWGTVKKANEDMVKGQWRYTITSGGGEQTDADFWDPLLKGDIRDWEDRKVLKDADEGYAEYLNYTFDSDKGYTNPTTGNKEADKPCKTVDEPYCGSYCFDFCRYKYWTDFPDETNDQRVFGLIDLSKTKMSDKDPRVVCDCYRTYNDDLSRAVKVTVPQSFGGCEIAGDKTPQCEGGNHNYCLEICIRSMFKFGYRSGGATGPGLDSVDCTCIN